MDQWINYICSKIPKEITLYLNNWAVYYHKKIPAEFYNTGFDIQQNLIPCGHFLHQIGFGKLYLGELHDEQVKVFI